MSDSDRQPQTAIPLEYASPGTRRQSTRLIGVVFSLVLAMTGVVLAGSGIAMLADAITHMRMLMLLPSVVCLTVGVIFCGGAWLIQARYVFRR